MANKVYIARETALTFQDSTGDVALGLNNLAAGVARISAQKDLGAGSKALEYTLRAVIEFDTAPVVGETIDIYLATSDGTDPDGQEGTSDANVGDNGSLNNMTPLGSLVVSTATVDHQMTTSFVIRIPTQYFSLVVHNNTADNLQATANTSWLVLTPIPFEIQ